MMNEYTTLASHPINVYRKLLVAGIDPQPLFASIGLDVTELIKVPESRIPAHKMTQLWHLIEDVSQDQSFGLKLAAGGHPMNFKALGLLLVACNSIAEGIQKLSHYYEVIANSIHIELHYEIDKIGLIMHPRPNSDIHPMGADLFFATIFNYCQQLSLNTHAVSHIELTRSLPKDSTPWQCFFHCPITFNAQQASIWFNRSVVEEVSFMRSRQIAAQNEVHVRSYIDSMQSSFWKYKTQSAIQQTIASQEPSVENIAKYLAMSPRALSRKLTNEGTTFRNVLKDKRKDLVKQYLSDTNMSISEIMFLLGFHDLSNFNRAFQRWFDCSPSQYRKSHHEVKNDKR
ncbi:MAG: AraC family transcriptional regulator ligand-binding domain-containing protein [Moritella sp.]|uniref:helix-turn-helix transcriptional regulator n=1 Tax=Moritella sp. TaxID=78556 RepID=UPI0029A5D81B|nr:AraC family transcriptional regulator ligand-binding domain-containing protein [Moritella sp.]MDX2319538.1 AraC family transcriptional regulator ligand-binding domain-containing protein [Moritella sp.]